MGWALGKIWHFQNSTSSAFLTAGRFCHIEALKLLFFSLPELELSKLFSTLMITDSSTDKEKGDLKQAVTTNMYFALSDQEKEARMSYCHFLIINVKKKKKTFWKCRHKNPLIWKRSGEKKWQILLTNSALGSYRKMGIRTKQWWWVWDWLCNKNNIKIRWEMCLSLLLQTVLWELIIQSILSFADLQSVGSSVF